MPDGTRVATCRVCRFQGGEAAGTWLLMDPAQPEPAAHAGHSLQLFLRPPGQLAGTGQIELHLDGTSVADIDLVLCPLDRLACVEHVRVDAGLRRHGYGRMLVAAALARAPDYRWSTTTIAAEAQKFWTALNVPDLKLGAPRYCHHTYSPASP